MKWYVLDSKSPGFSEIVNDDKHKINTNGSLSISDAQLENDGNYWVVISNIAGTATEQTEVSVTQRTGFLYSCMYNVTFLN